ncbi:MAG: hypothetical protein BZ136_08995 [Methanosphaera sp. rholeuAM74]|nr:MAG: hypothetical protein BZ136_08995 [Methanosphaera sp. rholeuAM74]
MFKRKTTTLFLLIVTMLFLVGISVVSATSNNDTVIQDNTCSGIENQSIAEDTGKLNKNYDNGVDNSLKGNYNTKESITTLTTEPTSTDRKIKITAEVKNTSGVRIKDSYFKLYYNNKLIKTIHTGSGLTRYYYTVPGTVEKATINAVYQGNSIYDSSFDSYTNYVSKQNTKTTLKVEPTSDDNQIKITADVRDKNNNLVQNSNFKVYCNGNLIKSIGTRSGLTRFYYNLPYTNGDATIKAVYQGSTLYKTSSNTYVGTLRKQNTYTYLSLEQTSVGNQIKITAEVRDDNYNLVQNSNFKVYCNGNLIKSIGTRSGLTRFYYNLPYTNGDVTIKAEYQGSANYYSSYDTYYGKLPQKRETYTHITVTKTESKKICITAEVTDTNYNLVKNSKFNLYADGKLITTIGTGSGITRYYYTVPKQYNYYTNITAKYLGNNLYKTSEDSEEIYVPYYIYEDDTDGYIEGDKITFRNVFMGYESGLEQFSTDKNLYIKQKSTGRIAKRHLDDGVYRFYDMYTGECVLE